MADLGEPGWWGPSVIRRCRAMGRGQGVDVGVKGEAVGGGGEWGKCVILEVKKQISEKGVITLSHYAHKSMKMKTENRI